MANPTLNSFINPTYYVYTGSQSSLYCGFLAGSTYVAPTFNGVSGAASNDPGGLFGWLIYSRTQLQVPAKGETFDSYIIYSNPNDFVFDLNSLSGVTSCLLTTSATQGGTFGFFSSDSAQITGKTNGNDFLSALYTLAYGTNLVITGSTAGFISFESQNDNYLDVLMCKGTTAEARYLENAVSTIGIFPSVNDGAGQTALNFDALFTSTSLVSGSTVADRIFSVSGKNYKFKIPTTSLGTNTTITNTINLVPDVVGAFATAKSRNNIYYTVAGLGNSTVLNGIVQNPINWTDTNTKNIFKKNRVNFYIKNDKNYFIGLDIVGATAGANSSYTSNDRIGPSKLRVDIETNVRTIVLKYVFLPNNATTRASITSEVSFYLQSLGAFLDPEFTQITCDSSNNDDNSSTLVVDTIVKPLISSEEFRISVITESST
jgi:hypothetical protein